MLEIDSTEAAALVCCDTLPFSTRLHSPSQADILIRLKNPWLFSSVKAVTTENENQCVSAGQEVKQLPVSPDSHFG